MFNNSTYRYLNKPFPNNIFYNSFTIQHSKVVLRYNYHSIFKVIPSPPFYLIKLDNICKNCTLELIKSDKYNACSK